MAISPRPRLSGELSRRLFPPKIVNSLRVTKIVKGERRGKPKTQFPILTVPNRHLSSTKIRKGERRIKYRELFLAIFYLEPSPGLPTGRVKGVGMPADCSLEPAFRFSQLVGFVPQECAQLFGGAVLGQSLGGDDVAERDVYGLVLLLEHLGRQPHGSQLPAY